MFGWLKRKPALPRSRFDPEARERMLLAANDAFAHGELESVTSHLQPLLQDDVPHPDALHLAAVAECRRGRFDQAQVLLARATDADPARIDSWHTLAEVRFETGDAQGAVEALRALLAQDPGYRPAHERLVFALHASGRSDEAIDTYQMHRMLDWTFDTATNPAAVFHAQGRLGDAVDALRARIATDRKNAALWNLLGATRQAQAHLDTAIACFREAVTLDEHDVSAHRRLAFALDTAGELETAVRHYRMAMELDPSNAQASSDHLAARLYTGWPSMDEARAAYEEHDRRHGSGRFPVGATAGIRDTRRRLRIGYVSGDFFAHAISYFFEPLLEHHDRSRFEIVCYDRTPQRDAVSRRLEQKADGWRCVHREDWDRLADRIRGDAIDILVDLKGHFDDNSLPLFARKPAPVQATWLGYPDTTGLRAMDAWLSDDEILAGSSAQYVSERAVSLGRFFMCFRPAAGAPEVTALPASRKGYVTFGCFNSYSKVSPAMRQAMAGILREVPESRLLVTAMPGGDTRHRLQEYFQSEGIAPHRIEMRGRGGHDEFLRWHGEVDIALDSFPYNGTTTALHSLWMGVPFVALAGTAHVSRVGASILANTNLREWIAADVEGYVRIASEQARTWESLATLRQSLRDRLLSSTIMDEASFTRRLEDCLLSLWRETAC